MKKRFIIVPKDKNAEKALDYDNATESQLITFELNERDFLNLFNSKVFNDINSINFVAISDFEDESITNKKSMSDTIEFFQSRLFSYDNNLRQHILKIVSLFEEAIERETGVYFYF